MRTEPGWGPTRADLGQRYGSTYGNKRKVQKELGRAEKIEPADHRKRYRRGGIARRIVRIYPSWVWRGQNTFTINGGRQAALDILIRKFRVERLLFQVHVFSDLTGYAGVVLEGDGAALESPPNAPIESYSVWGADCLKISEYDENTGLPSEYKLHRTSKEAVVIHPDRVIHYANGDLDSPLHGEPVLEAGWDILDDLDKVFGASGEAIWQTAIPDLHADIPLEEGADPDPEMIKQLDKQLDSYRHKLNRVIRSLGNTKIQKLGGQVPPPNIAGFVDTALILLSALYAIPKRILSGSERGELASTQDRLNWQEAIDEARYEIAVPMANFVIHELAAAAQVDLSTASTDEEFTRLDIAIEWEPWSTNRTPEEQTRYLTSWSKSITDAVNIGILAREVAVRLLPEEWFGPVDERYVSLDDEDPLGDDPEDPEPPPEDPEDQV